MRASVLSMSLCVLFACGKDGGDQEHPSDSGSDTELIDADQDGVGEDEDCDDTDASLGSVLEDADCDGVLTSEDCDDTAPELGALEDDGDCDGAPTDEDCDDSDPGSTILDEDGDCDGVLTEQDCDDADVDLGDISEDGDCDGTPTAEDCDDDDSTSTVVAEDEDCDGALTDEDCDDSDSSLNLEDSDEDGFSSCDGDCNDARSDRNPNGVDGMLSDGDCDGLAGGGWIRDAEYKFIGEKTGDYAGRMVASAGDVDGDGLSDVLVGAPYNGALKEGSVYLFFGSSLKGATTLKLKDADVKFVGSEVNDYSGISIASAGDVDGDGHDEVLIGTYDAGAFLFFGSDLGAESSVSLADADYIFTSEEPLDRAGFKLDGGGDVDGDGLGDLLISGHGNGGGGTGAGAAYLVFGSSLTSSGVFSLGDADLKFQGETEMANAGWGLAFAGDVDGDGLSDVAVGTYEEIGTVALFLSSSLPPTGTVGFSGADYLFEAEHLDDRFGWSFDQAGDMDGDGLGDLVFGAYSNDELSDGGGAVYVILGASLGGASIVGMADADFKILGDQKRTYAGHSVAGAGDLDSDGRDDVLIGVPEDHEGGQDSGAVSVLLGSGLPKTGSATLDEVAAKLIGESSSARLGIAVAPAGDVNGDGQPDVILGAYGEDEGGDYAGAAYLVLGD